MSILWNNSNRVKHLKYDGNTYVHELNYNGTIVWEETFGTWVPGTLPEGVSSLSCSRTSLDPAISAGTITSGAELYNKDTLNFVLTPVAYWTPSRTTFTHTIPSPSSGNETTLSAQTVLSLVPVTLSRTMKTITVTLNTGVSEIYLTYKDSTGTTAYKTFNSSGTVSVWAGAVVSWTATATSGYTLDSSSGIIAIGYASATIAPTATLASQWRTTGYTGSHTWSGMTSSTATAYNLLTHTYESGLNAYPSVRVSGTVTMTQINSTGSKSGYGTMSFSNVELTAGTSGTNIADLAFTYKLTATKTATAYLSVYIKNAGTNLYASNKLSCYISSSSYGYVGKVVVSITKVEVYTQYDGNDLVVRNDDTGFYVDPLVTYEGKIGIVGAIGWSSTQWSSDSYSLIPLNGGEIYIDSSTFGGSGDDSMSECSLSIALFNTNGEPISSPQMFEV